MRNHQLLLTEAEMFWGYSATGRLRTGGPALVLAASDIEVTALPGSGLSGDVVARIHRLVEAAPHVPPDRMPPVLGRCASLLGPAVLITGGPSYLIPPTVEVESDSELVCVGDPAAERLREANPGNWEPQEWLDLLDGRLGPWAMAVQGQRVTSICHTPAHSAVAADAGVWTDPDFRGRGLAAAVTVAWFRLISAGGRTAFYSTAS